MRVRRSKYSLLLRMFSMLLLVAKSRFAVWGLSSFYLSLAYFLKVIDFVLTVSSSLFFALNHVILMVYVFQLGQIAHKRMHY